MNKNEKRTTSFSQLGSDNYHAVQDSETQKRIIEAPKLSLPKGGGAIKGIGEKFATNPVTGTGSMTLPIAASPGRSGFGPQLTLSYDSGSGNGPFGFGWSLSLPSITRKTDKGLPRYFDAEESDVFILSGAEDLVPAFEAGADGDWIRDADGEIVLDRERDGYTLRSYRPRVEGLFARIERWTNPSDPTDVFWRSISKDNIATWYGKARESRIYDPADGRRIFSWLICESHDDKGNAIVYEYQAENSAGVDLSSAHEANRSDETRAANVYLKRIKYGNERSRLIESDPSLMRWKFELIFDYGECHCPEDPPDGAGQVFVAPSIDPAASWPARLDPFSSYRPGFEVRTYRLCRKALMFHHFDDELRDENGHGIEDYLVRSTEFEYDEGRVSSRLISVTQSGFVYMRGGKYLKKTVPPLEFGYSAVPDADALRRRVIEDVDHKDLENLPVGLAGYGFQFMDLDGVGISDPIAEQGGSLWRKPNLSPRPLREDGSEVVRARFGAQTQVALLPSGGIAHAGRQLLDLAGDGQPDLVDFGGALPGFWENDPYEGWKLHRPFQSLPALNWNDPQLRFVDLNGDGHADILLTEDRNLRWYPSLGEEGFGEAMKVAGSRDEELGPVAIFADSSDSVYLADMSGDGLTDLVRIRNSELCYWPSLGYGKFGPKVTLDTPLGFSFDYPDQFDQKRVRLADIDGSGTTDILYLGRDGAHIYFNQSGNALSDAVVMPQFPSLTDPGSLQAMDLLGNGTACLVKSSSAPGQIPLRYLRLMEEKPHLLVSVKNNLGAETVVRYAPSTAFFLKDKFAGKPWITRLPFPVHVVEGVETYDRVGRNRFVTRYAYHHGYFDGEEREFRGFGCVEQWDTEEFAALSGDGDLPPGSNSDAATQLPPVRTCTWFHTGAYQDAGRISLQFASEYYGAPDKNVPGYEAAFETFLRTLLPDTVFPDGLEAKEKREACRALKGSILRQEVYADDETERSPHPYTVSERNYTIGRLQPRDGNRHEVFFVHPREQIDYYYERNPVDPRISHGMTLEVDDFGNILKSAAVAYGRKESDLVAAADKGKQEKTLVTYTENAVTTAIDEEESYRTPLICETRTYELSGYAPSGPSGRYDAADFVRSDPLDRDRLIHFFDTEIDYEDADGGANTRRLIEHVRTLFRADDLSGLLPLGSLGSRALPAEAYRLAFTPGLLAAVYKRKKSDGSLESLLPHNVSQLSALLVGEGGYRGDEDGNFWIPSGRTYYIRDANASAAEELEEARAHFFLPRRIEDPFGNCAFVDYDTHDLLPAGTEDALQNTTVATSDYRVLQPSMIRDPNGNETEVAFDALGLVAATAVMGKNHESGDSVKDLILDLSDAQLGDFFSDPKIKAPRYLGKATTRILYDLDRYRNSASPAYAAGCSREIHSAMTGAAGSPVQVAFSYSDGFGREIQKKIQAEKGPTPGRDGEGRILVNSNNQPEMGDHDVDPRWVGSGWTIFNNKGRPVCQYEPFFTDRHEFEFDVRLGVSPVLFYDPVERIIATLHADRCYEKVVFDPWRQRIYDANDTVAAHGDETGDPRTDADICGYVSRYFASRPAAWETWYAQRAGGAMGALEQSAANKASAHAGTPGAIYYDSLGRPFMTVADNGPRGKYSTRVELDIENNRREVRDTLLESGTEVERVVMRYDYDMLGNRIRQTSMEAGERWALNDAGGKPIRGWDSRGHNFWTSYDVLRRPVSSAVRGTNRAYSDPQTIPEDLVFERVEYGEGQRNDKKLNLRTRVFRQYDGAGMLTNIGTNPVTNQDEGYDFKGNVLRSARIVAKDHTRSPNWKIGPNSNLGTEGFTQAARYDALNRPVQLIGPYSDATGSKPNVVQPTYNEANLLESVGAWFDLPQEPSSPFDPNVDPPSEEFVKNIDYNAKGQHALIEYGNDTRTSYEYDRLTYRLTRLRTARGAARASDCPPQLRSRTCEDPPALCGQLRNRLCVVQDLSYTYDPIGNISHICDDAQQVIYFKNKRVEPSADYSYDALYRLIGAVGREHLGQVGAAPLPHSYNDLPRAGRVHPADGKAMGTYLEEYDYDVAGNCISVKHGGLHPTSSGWKRNYAYGETSLIEDGAGGRPVRFNNRLSSTTIGTNNPTPETYTYDVHGNMTAMPQLSAMSWNFKDELTMTRRQRVNAEDREGIEHEGERCYYAYDASGQRVRKVWEKSQGLTEERIYLGGFEIFRKRDGGGAVTLERETLHISDDKQRIALIETRRAGSETGIPARVIRYQYGNHLGSACLELDEEASIISYEEYYPYGGSSYQAAREKTEVPPKRYRYSGKERDEESGLYYYGARYYASWLGRWTACDPAGTVDGLNLYEYVNDHPTILIDKKGMRIDTDNGDPPETKTQANVEPHEDSKLSPIYEKYYGNKHYTTTEQEDDILDNFKTVARGYLLQDEPTPRTAKEKSKDVDISSPEHDAAVIAIINLAIDAAYADARKTSKKTKEIITNEQLLRKALFLYITSLRQEGKEDTTQNLLLRDVDHYFAGRIMEYQKMEPIIPLGKDNWFAHGMGLTAAKVYDSIKRGYWGIPIFQNRNNAGFVLDEMRDYSPSKDRKIFPAAAPGGRLWAELGSEQSIEKHDLRKQVDFSLGTATQLHLFVSKSHYSTFFWNELYQADFPRGTPIKQHFFDANNSGISL